MNGDELLTLGVTALAARVRDGRLSAERAVGAAVAAAERADATGLNAFTRRHGTARTALAAAGRVGGAAADHRAAARGRRGGALAGVAVAVGDDHADLALPTTAGSRVLAGYVSPYEAGAVARLLDAGAVVVGKTNIDEFGMGWGTETSAYGATQNPTAAGRTPGGAAGGAAAAVAAGAVRVALGTDTTGAVRQAAAGCGVVGLRPTYGRVSRAGVVAVASSLDQVGLLARTVDDAAAALAVIAGRDPRDATTADLDTDDLPPPAAGGPRPLAGLRVARARELVEAALPAVRERVDAVAALARELGANVDDVSVEQTELALPAAVAIAAAEAASNLARFDGVRFGLRATAAGPRALFDGPRAAGFGLEVVRRIVLGTHLTSVDGTATYQRAQEARATVARALAAVLDDAELLLAPITPGPALPVGVAPGAREALRYDALTAPASLAGLPALALPAGRVDGAPVGVQLIARHFGEPLLLRVARALEAALLTTFPARAGAPT